jgi:phosphoribosylamine--glycine ligase
LKVLVVGGGGREHALAWKLERDGTQVVVAPGNGGTPGCVSVQPSDSSGLAVLAERERVDLTIVGPEAPLAAGLVDDFAARGLVAFGPTRAAARLEWSKGWTKAFLGRHGVPTAGFEIVDSEVAARRAVGRVQLPVVLKADGLASGKGVFVCLSPADVDAACRVLFGAGRLGLAAEQVLVEEFLEGPELSVLAFTDGERFAIMPPARDYKRLLDGDRGPNTGGMGGVTWPSYATPDVLEMVAEQVLAPTVAGMASEGNPYRGVLYAGLMLTRAGPRVLEFNCRFGDPECQLILPLLKSNLADTCQAAASGALQPADVEWSRRRTCGVVLAADGYPAAPRAGDAIEGLSDVSSEALVFHAGTQRLNDGRLVTAGGRVLTVVGFDRTSAYAAANAIHFAGKQLRSDIGLEPDARGAA